MLWLLGFNGVEKSTIYKMLTGEIKMSAGKAVLYDYEFTKDQEMVSNIMYLHTKFNNFL